MTTRDSEYGIRWTPTIIGAVLVLWAFAWIISGALGPKHRTWTMVAGVVMLGTGIALLRWGRRGITRSLKSAGRDDHAA